MVQSFFGEFPDFFGGLRRLISAWWSGYFAGVFADFVVQRGGKSW
jgi:hypothetical protein